MGPSKMKEVPKKLPAAATKIKLLPENSEKLVVKPESGSDDEDLVEPSPVQPTKKKTSGQSKKLLVSNDSDDSDFGSTVTKQKVKKSSSAKPPAPKKAKVSKPKAAKKTKKR